MDYDYRIHAFLCKACGEHQAMEGRPDTCPACGQALTRHTWFDPSGCEACHFSFVD